MAFDLSIRPLNHSSRVCATIVHGQSLSCAPMTTYSERLTLAMHAAAVDVHALARHLGISYTAVKKAMDGGTKALTSANNSKAAALLHVDANWLATGTGERVNVHAWPFRKLTLAQLHELEAASPGSLENIEKTALALLLLAQTPTLTSEQQIDTEAEDESALHEWESKKADSAGGIGDHASTDPEKQPSKRNKRPKGVAQAGRER